LKDSPKVIQAHLMLGNAYLLKRDLTKAQKSFEEVIKIAPQNPMGYFHMGRVLFAQKKEKEALVQLEKALSLQPNFIDALNESYHRRLYELEGE